MRGEKREVEIIAPGELLKEESYKGENDHPEFMEYLRRDDSKWVMT